MPYALVSLWVLGLFYMVKDFEEGMSLGLTLYFVSFYSRLYSLRQLKSFDGLDWKTDFCSVFISIGWIPKLYFLAIAIL